MNEATAQALNPEPAQGCREAEGCRQACSNDDTVVARLHAATRATLDIPEMNVVRSVRFGIRSRSLVSSLTVWSCAGRFMDSRTRLLMCCSGMSMYLHTCVMRCRRIHFGLQPVDGWMVYNV